MPAPVGPGEWVVRHYHRGGAVASVLGDRYLRLGTPRPFRELRVGRALEERGAPVVPHVGALVYPAGPWYRGDLVTERVPAAADLAALLFGRAAYPGEDGADGDGAAREDGAGSEHGTTGEDLPELAGDLGAVMAVAGRAVRRFHEAGGVHRDLNLKNVLVARAPAGPEALQAVVLDLDRASVRRAVGGRARGRMLERFWRSARKWESRTGRTLEPGLAAAFRAAYEAVPGPPPGRPGGSRD